MSNTIFGVHLAQVNNLTKLKDGKLKHFPDTFDNRIAITVQWTVTGKFYTVSKIILSLLQS